MNGSFRSCWWCRFSERKPNLAGCCCVRPRVRQGLPGTALQLLCFTCFFHILSWFFMVVPYFPVRHWLQRLCSGVPCLNSGLRCQVLLKSFELLGFTPLDKIWYDPIDMYRKQCRQIERDTFAIVWHRLHLSCTTAPLNFCDIVVP